MTSLLDQRTPRIVPLQSKAWISLTPQALFSALAEIPSLFWLDSGDSAVGWSYIGYGPARRLSSTALMSFAAYSNHDDKFRDDLPPFQSGILLQLNYPAGNAPFCLSKALVHSALRGYRFDTVFAYAHAQKAWFCVSNAQHSSFRRVRESVESVASSVSDQKHSKHENAKCPKGAVHFAIDMHYFCAIQCALDYIKAGDVYQINISKFFAAPWQKSSAELYLEMRAVSAPSYGAYLGPALAPNGHAVCCISPELFLRVSRNEVLTRPIKGTRPLGSNVDETLAARRELESSAKERAELNMIVDLERNDLGRVCRDGSVRVVSSGEVEQLPTLLHRSATVSGQLRPGTTLGELLTATFPGGSVTGAPKIRAMQIIAELEREPRGPYCGAIGWFGRNGLELNIAIRTALVDSARKEARYFAGSGIVADSDPEKEHAETVLKAAPFLAAVNRWGN